MKEVFKKKQKSKSGYQSEVTVYECEDCGGCPYKEKCTKAKGNKRLYFSKNFLRKRQESYENILSERGILYRINRSIQVEGAFGILKNDYEFQRFLLRRKTKVKLELLLLCLGYNLNKLHSKIQNGRTGSHLFPGKKRIEKVNSQEALLKYGKNPTFALKPEQNAGFFAITSGSAAQSSILMILRHSLCFTNNKNI